MNKDFQSHSNEQPEDPALYKEGEAINAERTGIAKGKIILRDGFDEAFDALDKEIADEFEKCDDPFYSEENMARLRRSAAQMEDEDTLRNELTNIRATKAERDRELAEKWRAQGKTRQEIEKLLSDD